MSEYESKHRAENAHYPERNKEHFDLPRVHSESFAKPAQTAEAPVTKIHARFKLGEDTRVPCHQPKKDGNGWEQVNGLRVKLYPVTGEPFGSATPSGELTMVLANPEAIRVFKEAEIGQEYDVIFSPVQKAE
ncbi:MAG TPA: hypothetical protein VGL94_08450 [Ktedonobacteraceae bacterium]|jgi:hypothetical protein